MYPESDDNETTPNPFRSTGMADELPGYAEWLDDVERARAAELDGPDPLDPPERTPEMAAADARALAPRPDELIPGTFIRRPAAQPEGLDGRVSRVPYGTRYTIDLGAWVDAQIAKEAAAVQLKASVRALLDKAKENKQYGAFVRLTMAVAVKADRRRVRGKSLERKAV
jgi:hypothetical protein